MTLPAFHTFFYFKSEKLENIYICFLPKIKCYYMLQTLSIQFFLDVSVIIQTIAGLYFEF